MLLLTLLVALHNKAGAYRFTGTAIQVVNTRKNDGSVLYEMELYDGEQDMAEQNKEVDNMNDWDRLHRQAQRYQLGKTYLYGKEIEQDYEKAIAYLSSAAEHGNPYAEQLLHGIHSNRNWSAALGAIRLLYHLSRMIQNQLNDENKGKAGGIDRKLKRKIDEKKQAHGLKQG